MLEPPGDRLVKLNKRTTLADVAVTAGVSRSTVSLVLNGSASIPEETKRRVEAAATQVGYVYNRRAAGLRTQRSGLVAIAINDLESPYFAEVVAGAQAEIERQGDVAIISNSSEDPARQEAFLARIREYAVDGLLICPSAGGAASLRDAAMRSAPHVVMFSRHLDGFEGHYCGGDNYGGIRQVMSHLCQAGHRHFAYLGSSQDASPARDRLRGFRNGLPNDAKGVEFSIFPSREAGYRATNSILDHIPGATAIVCYNDTIAFGAFLALRARNLVPGRDLSISGFDNVAEAELWVPGLTSVEVPRRELGQRAASMLYRALAGDDIQLDTSELPARLLARGSTGN